MITIEQALLLCPIVLIVLITFVSLLSLSKRETRQHKPEDERMEVWPRYAASGRWKYHHRDECFPGRFLITPDGEILFVCRDGQIFDSTDFKVGDYFRREPWT